MSARAYYIFCFVYISPRTVIVVALASMQAKSAQALHLPNEFAEDLIGVNLNHLHPASMF